ncbi:stemmadenine O-acetyltransferase-like isoform X2 [Argentina anserina]|uniref:stemmadenine O-acetyltransferase-like isoform X2 n=1 Tax=Argentina anserina TaxID=57926 RepID=UPI002176672F|nr:stemmadenine O-acetyltransferase-like isoform X2 [Potentilla anserina]
MKVEVELISEEIIKPSSSTPDDLRHYQLSLLDQLSPPVYNPLILFYEFNDEAMPSITEISNHLKRSLAEVLTLFYPLAGRIVDNKYVNCNDEGIPYVEARVKCELSEVLNNPAPGEFNGLSHFMFSKTWATTALGDKTKIEHPEFISAELFPPRDFTPYDAGLGVTKYKVVKRFVFSASLIESLRARYSDSLGLESQKPISRVDALSAFIWSRYVANTKDIGPAEKLYMVLHSVNLRPRFDPPLPQHSFGNFYRAAMTAPFVSRGNDCYGLVMKQVREEIEKIDDHYMRSLQQGVGHLSELNESVDSVISGELITFSFSSFCRFPLYDNDFGWGKPIWVSSPPLTFKNLVVFMDTKEADGIEAYISLEEEVMAKFETDIEFLAYVSLSGC